MCSDITGFRPATYVNGPTLNVTGGDTARTGTAVNFNAVRPPLQYVAASHSPAYALNSATLQV